MPVAGMSRVSIIAHTDHQPDLVERLHEMGVMQVTDAAAAIREGSGGLFDVRPPSTRNLRLAIARCDFLIELLERYEERRGGLAGFTARRVHLEYREFLAAPEEVDLEALYRELEAVDIELRRIKAGMAEIESELVLLQPWEPLALHFETLEELETVAYRTVIVGLDQLDAWEEEMEMGCPYSTWDEVHRGEERAYLLVLTHRSDLGDCERLAGEFFLEEVLLGLTGGTVRERMRVLEEEARELNVRRAGLEEEIRQALTLKPRLLALGDYFANQLLKEEVRGNFVYTGLAVALEGWVETSRVEELRSALWEMGDDVDMGVDEPGEGELAPTLLVNRRRVRPAESLIELFGLPERSETDPTPFVAPFFILFFAMCISDFGYGLVLSLVFYFAMKKLDLGAKTRRFLRLFFYCGLATMVMGILTRGYFGIESDSLPEFLKIPGTYEDVLRQPQLLMLICAGLGLLHISIGTAIEMYDNVRANSLWRGFCEQGTTLLAWLGLALAAVGFLAGADPLGKAGLYVMAAGAAGVVLLSNIGSRSIAGKFFGGLFNLYGLLGGTIGDVASYLRLYALGLATIAIGMVVNMMAGMVLDMPVLGVVFFLLVLAGGHAFNLAVNFLGAFVHPLRLQYVEFFGKFYEDGGEPFTPFALETHKVVIDDR